jgi:hypothetical protein
MSFNGKEIEIPPLAGLPPLRIVHRADLHRALHDVAQARGVHIEHGKHLTAIDSSQPPRRSTQHSQPPDPTTTRSPSTDWVCLVIGVSGRVG